MLNDQPSLNLQSWLPLELHPQINALLVGFGQTTIFTFIKRSLPLTVGPRRRFAFLLGPAVTIAN